MQVSNPEFQIQATNVSNLEISLGDISIDKVMELNRPENYQVRQDYMPAEPLNWTQTLTLVSNKSHTVDVDLSPFIGTIDPGLYRLTMQGWYGNTSTEPEKLFVVASNVNLVLKIGATDALIWAVDLRDSSPVSDAPVAIYDVNGHELASGRTDADGLFYAQFEPLEGYLGYAVLGQPGEDW